VSILIGQKADVSTIRFKDSVLWGQTDLLPADQGVFCVESYGFILSASTYAGQDVPEGAVPSYDFIKSYSNWFTEPKASNIKFKNWGSGVRS